MSKYIFAAICSVVFVFSAGLASAHHVDCSRDINNDGKTNAKDMKIIDDAFGSKVGAAPYDERADLDRDGFVNRLDRDAYSHCVPLALQRNRNKSR